MKNIYVIHGPNLNLLGTRESVIYGEETLAEINLKIENLSHELGLHCQFFQSNLEGEIVGFVQDAARRASGLIINPGGYSHTSVAILDALRATDIPKIEVHLSNIFAREEYRWVSLTAQAATGSISGLGVRGYLMALRFLSERLDGHGPKDICQADE